MALPDNEFKDLTIAELRALATQFDVDVKKLTKKSDIIGKITGAGITWDMYQTLTALPDAEGLEPVDEPVQVEPVPAPIQVEPVAEPEQPELPFEVEWPEYSATDEDFVEEPAAPVEPEVVIVPVPVKEEEPEWTVVKMDRDNRIFQAFGYEFSREHPYMLVKTEEANVLIEEIGGFRAASPRELKEYYPN